MPSIDSVIREIDIWELGKLRGKEREFCINWKLKVVSVLIVKRLWWKRPCENITEIGNVLDYGVAFYNVHT